MSLLAQIENPVLSNFGTGGKGAAPGYLAQLVAILWRTALILGGLAVFIFFILGGYEWLTAGGDKEKVARARNRLLNAVIGLAIIFITTAFVSVVFPRFGFDILQFDIPEPAGTAASTPTGGGGGTGGTG